LPKDIEQALSKWFARKEELEMCFNEKIVDIRQHPDDNRVIEVFVQLSPLPEYLEWSDRFIGQNNFLSIGINHLGLITMNLEKYPHAFIAGETGSGKSNMSYLSGAC
jgi:hypothetical protein